MPVSRPLRNTHDCPIRNVKKNLAMSATLRIYHDIMSQLAKSLSAVLTVHSIPQAHLARAAGLDPSTLTRVLAGAQTPTPDNLGRILSAIPDPMDRAHVLRGYIQDLIPPGYEDRYTVIMDTAIAEDRYIDPIDKALAGLKKAAVSNQDLRDTIVFLAKVAT